MTLLSALYRLKSPTSFSGLTVHPTDLITPSHLHFIAFLSVTAATRHFQITHFTVNDTFRRSAFSNYRLLIHACACAAVPYIRCKQCTFRKAPSAMRKLK